MHTMIHFKPSHSTKNQHGIEVASCTMHCAIHTLDQKDAH